MDVAKLVAENLRLSDEVREVNADAEEAKSNFVRSQGPLIQAYIYKTIQSKAFGDYVNHCGMALTHRSLD